MNEGFLGLVDLYTCGGAAMLSRGLPGGSQHSECLPMLKEDFEGYPLQSKPEMDLFPLKVILTGIGKINGENDKIVEKVL